LGPDNVAKVWNVSNIYITENGCSATDVPAADGPDAVATRDLGGRADGLSRQCGTEIAGRPNHPSQLMRLDPLQDKIVSVQRA
jgi:hypothetical protein